MEGSLGALSDGSLVTAVRFAAPAVRAPGFFIQWDFGTSTSIEGFKLGSGAAEGEFPAVLDIFYADDPTGPWTKWRTLGRVMWPGAFSLTTQLIGDDYSPAVVLLVPFDSTDTSGAPVDFSSPPKTFAKFGGAVVDTSDSRFGAGSLLLATPGSYITTTSGAFAIGTQDFTVEGWIKTAQTGERVIFDSFASGSGTSSWQLLMRDGTIVWYGNGYLASATSVVNDGAWHHVAATREAGTLRMFVDGNLEATTAYGSALSAQLPFTIGAQINSRNSAYDLVGHVDDVRFTIGVARYVASFPPPAQANPLPNAALGPLLLQTSRPFAAAQFFSESLPFAGARGVSRPQLLRDMQYAGRGQIVATVKEDHDPLDLPVRRRVRLFRDRDGVMIRETWSDAATGAYAFTEIDENERYSVVAYDHLENYRAVIADRIQPTVP